MRITQKDIARRLGISPSLVSRALSGTASDIGADPATVQRIQDQAAAMGYVPSAAARQLRGQGTAVIGLTVADLQDPFFGPAVAEVIGQCHRAGYALALTGFERRQPGLPDVRLLLQQDLHALLVLGSGPLEWARPFAARGCPVIRIGRGESLPGVADISVDDALGMELVVRHLVGLGHRAFAFIGADLESHRPRRQFVQDALRKHKLDLSPRHAVLAGSEVLEAGVAGTQQLARTCGEQWPSAIICSSDAVALGVLREVSNQGRRVPEHVSVSGFDDLGLALLSTPPLTSVRQPLAAMIQDALRLTTAPRRGATHLIHAPHLVIRDSTAPARRPA